MGVSRSEHPWLGSRSILIRTIDRMERETQQLSTQSLDFYILHLSSLSCNFPTYQAIGTHANTLQINAVQPRSSVNELYVYPHGYEHSGINIPNYLFANRPTHHRDHTQTCMYTHARAVTPHLITHLPTRRPAPHHHPVPLHARYDAQGSLAHHAELVLELQLVGEPTARHSTLQHTV